MTSSSSPTDRRRLPAATHRLQILVSPALADAVWEIAYGEGLALSTFVRRELELIVDRERRRRS